MTNSRKQNKTNGDLACYINERASGLCQKTCRLYNQLLAADKLKMRIFPKQVFFLYMVVIVISAIIYNAVPGIFLKPITLIDGLYFSVVTITTLGYGDLSPASNFGKLFAAAEAFFGVILLGLFLMSVANQIANTEERKRKISGKANLKVQYDNWRREVIMSLLFLSNPGRSVNSQLAKELLEPSKFKVHFSENKNERWYAIANNLSKDNYYSKEIVWGLESLQHHIQTFIAITPISNEKVLQRLTGYINLLNRMRRLDIDHYDDQKSFLRDLWSIVALWDFETGEYGRDYLIEAIEEA